MGRREWGGGDGKGDFTLSPNDGVHRSCKQYEDLRVEEREVIEAVLPANDGTHHEEPGTAEEHHHKEDDDLGVGRSRRVGGEGELET